MAVRSEQQTINSCTVRNGHEKLFSLRNYTCNLIFYPDFSVAFHGFFHSIIFSRNFFGAFHGFFRSIFFLYGFFRSLKALFWKSFHMREISSVGRALSSCARGQGSPSELQILVQYSLFVKCLRKSPCNYKEKFLRESQCEKSGLLGDEPGSLCLITRTFPEVFGTVCSPCFTRFWHAA
jgi:hypothetical protein